MQKHIDTSESLYMKGLTFFSQGRPFGFRREVFSWEGNKKELSWITEFRPGEQSAKSRLSQPAQQRVIELFVSGSTARTAAALVGVNKNVTAYYFHRLRQRIYQTVEDETLFWSCCQDMGD